MDEAYLEPDRRTLEAELTLSQREQSSAADLAHGISPDEREVAKRPRIGITGYVPSPRTTDGARRGVAGESSCESQEWVEEDEEAGCFTMRVAGGGGVEERRWKHKDTNRTEEEVDRLLETGGLLGVRIQRELRQVLEYDCSVGVAQNKVRERTIRDEPALATHVLLVCFQVVS